MRRSIVLGILVLIALIPAPGCIFSPETDPPPPPDTDYHPQTSPEDVVHNLQVSYRRRDAIEYAKLLHPEFIFVFQSTDVQEVGSEFWTRDTDTTQTKNLFDAIEVTRITIDLTYGAAAPVSPGSDTLTIRVNPTELEVDQLELDGTTTTWKVSGDIQDLFFVRSESNPEIWQILEWRDIPGGSGPAVRIDLLSEGGTPARRARAVSWGALLHRAP